MNPELHRSLDELITTNYRLVELQRPWRYFMRGMIYGIGATVGAALAIAIAGSVLHLMAGVDIFRPFAQQVLPYVEQQGKAIISDDDYVTPSYTASSPSPSPSPETSPSPDIAATPTP